MTARTAAERFDAKWEPEPMSGCWLWMAAQNSRGYGTFWDGSRNVRAHRHSYERHVSPIPEGLVIDHLCRNPSCVNPAHLEVVTHRENLMRGVGLAATNARRTHCARGHELCPDNTHPSRRAAGWRTCKICEGEAATKLKAKRKAAGLCVRCAQVAQPGRICCRQCAGRVAAYQRQRRNRQTSVTGVTE